MSWWCKKNRTADLQKTKSVVVNTKSWTWSSYDHWSIISPGTAAIEWFLMMKLLLVQLDSLQSMMHFEHALSPLCQASMLHHFIRITFDVMSYNLHYVFMHSLSLSSPSLSASHFISHAAGTFTGLHHHSSDTPGSSSTNAQAIYAHAHTHTHTHTHTCSSSSGEHWGRACSHWVLWQLIHGTLT